MATATYRGTDLFGPQVTTLHRKNPVAEQRASFPGIDGVQRVYLGSRGHTLRVECLLAASDPAGLESLAADIEAMADDQAGEFVTERGRVFSNVVYSGEGAFEGPMGFLANGLGVCQKYACTFHALTD